MEQTPSVLQQVDISGTVKSFQRFLGYMTRADGLKKKIVDGIVCSKRVPKWPKTN